MLFDEQRREIVWYDEENDAEYAFPAKFEVCPACEGRGQTTDPAVDGDGLTRDELAEDLEFAADYFAGRYDQLCDECGGHRVVPIIDLDAAKKLGLIDAVERFQDEQRADADYAAVQAAERKQGA